MNSVELTHLVDALTEIAAVLGQLGVPGMILLALAGPALVLCAVLAIEYHRGCKMQAMVETLRLENDLARKDTTALLETYRADTQSILRELGAGLDQTDQYYRDNVELVKGYHLIAKNLQDVVVSNTSAVSRLNTMLEERRHSHG